MVTWNYWPQQKAGVYLPTGLTCVVFAEVEHKGVLYFRAVLDGEGYNFSAPAEKFLICSKT